MTKIQVLGAAGSLGRHVVQQAVDAGHEVAVMVRTPSQLPAAWRDRVHVHQADIAAVPVDELAARLIGHDVVINTAGFVTNGTTFVALVEHISRSLQAIAPEKRPVAWFLAGAGLLDIGETRRRALDLPFIRRTYWPHLQNLKTLETSTLDFRLLCPGPMVQGPAVGLDRMRVAIDRLPVVVPAAARWLPDLALVPVFVSRVPQLIIPFADAATLILANLHRESAMSRRRIGVALPVGMRGKKELWAAQKPKS